MTKRARRTTKPSSDVEFLPNPLVAQVRKVFGLSAVAAALSAAPAAHAVADVRVPTPEPKEPRQRLTGTGKEVVFVDVGVEDYERLTGALPHGLEVVMLDPSRDALGQISEALMQRSQVDSVHVISHGKPGELMLGGRSYTADDLEGSKDRLALWFSPTVRAEAGRPDIMLYGCNVGAGEDGKAFLDRLAKLTGADVAASDDLTGSPLKGGDWELEVATGLVETRQALVTGAVDYPHTLDTFTVTNTNDSGAGSLRQAVIDANANPGFDTVDLTDVTGTINVSTSIYSNDPVEIIGPGPNDLTLDGGSENGIFSASDDFSISGVTLADGNAEGGGAIHFDSEGEGGNELRVEDVVFYCNSAGVDGGAIHASSGSDVEIIDSRFEYNFSNGEGGAIFVRQSDLSITGSDFRYNRADRGGGINVDNAYDATLSISDSEFVSNDAERGGAAYFDRMDCDATLTIEDSEFRDNYADNGGGGIQFCEIAGGSQVTVTRSTFEDNCACGNGGGINVYRGMYGQAQLTVTDSDFLYNETDTDGGGIHIDELNGTSRVTIRNNDFLYNEAGSDGGGVSFGDLYDNSVAVVTSTFTGNIARRNEGGGIAFDNVCDNAGVTVYDSEIKYNGAEDGAGGLYVSNVRDNGLVTIANNTIENNYAQCGGGICIGDNVEQNGRVQILGGTISGNTSSYEGETGCGGGIYIDRVEDNGTVLVGAVTLNNNDSHRDGGGIFIDDINDYGQVKVANSTLSDNYASEGGGGIALQNANNCGTLLVENSTVSGNTADGEGGGLWFYNTLSGAGAEAAEPPEENDEVETKSISAKAGDSYTNVRIAHSTITDNFAASSGGGIFNCAGMVTLDHSIVAGNEAEEAGYSNDLNNEYGDFYARFSLIGNSESGEGGFEGPGNVTDVYVGDVIEPFLADNGGPTLTHDLAVGSPALNAGDPGFNPPPVSDQRGFGRVAQGVIDIGAVEVGGEFTEFNAIDYFNSSSDGEVQTIRKGIGEMPLFGLMLGGVVGLWRRLVRRR